MILITVYFQVSPVAADYSQCSRVGWKIITGIEETTIPNIDTDDGFQYIVSSAQTGTIPGWLMTNPSAYAIYSGTLLGTNSLSNMTYSDNVYWNVRSALGSGRYNPNSYVPLNSTQWKAGSLTNVTSDDNQYMSFESYPVCGQYGIRFNGTYMINAGNRRFLNLTGPFTIELRIRLDRNYPSSTESDLMALVSKHTGGDLGYWMWSTLTRYNSTASDMYVQNRFVDYSDPQTISCIFKLKVGVWRHLAWVYDGSNNTLYVDGVRQAGWKSGALPSPGSIGSFLIGGYQSYLLDYCSLDEVAVWNSSKWSGSSFSVPTSPYLGSEANLCGLWHMDEGDGAVAKDSSPNHYDATATNQPFWIAGYKFLSNPPYPDQYALEFDDTYLINVGNKAALNLTAPFTIEFRIKWNTAPVGTSGPYNRFVIGKTTGGYGYMVWLEPTGGGWVTIQAQLNGNSEGGSSPYKYTVVNYNFRPSVGAWQHFAWVHNGTQMRLYFNGTNVRSLSTSYLPKPVTYPFLIGGEDYLSGPWLANITLDEVAVWGSAKYTANFASPTRPYVGNEANLRGLWHLDEGSGTTAHDSSPYHSDGTATSRPIWAAGYHRIQLVNLQFSGASNTNSWQSLMWKTDLSCALGSVNATIQFFNWTAGRYQTSGEGYLNYITNVNPNTDETKTQTLTLGHQQLRDPSTGNWKMNIRLWTVTLSSFQSKFDLIEYDPLSSGMNLELQSVLPDRNIKTGVSTLNVTVEVKCNASTVTHNLYVFNYSKGAYEFRQTLEVDQVDTTFHVNITSKASDFISQTGGIEIKVNSTYSGTFITSFDLVQWDLKYCEPAYENYWRVDYRATIPKTEITRLSVKLKSGLNRTTGVAFLSMYNYTISSWTPIVQNVNHSSMLTHWYNTTTPSSIQGFIRSDGCLNVTFYAYDTNWTTFKVSTDHLAIWVESPTLDSTPPSPIANLVVIGSTDDSAALTWTAPGDDLDSGMVSGYEVKYSTSGPVSTSNWDSAVTYSVSWTLLPAGGTENLVVSGLSPDTNYWFAVKAYDEVPNRGGISNSPSGKTGDLVAPAVIDDLVAGNPAVDSITLGWTAPGDNGFDGTAVGYVVRYSTSGPVTDESWESATTYAQSWVPMGAGGNETHVVYGLNSSTLYWFAIKAYDEAPNYGGVSNSAEETTATPQTGGGGSLTSILIVVVPVALIAIAGVGVIGMKVMGRSRQVGPKSPFRRRSKVVEGVARPKLREYVGESGVVPQPKKKAKFEEESGADRNEKK